MKLLELEEFKEQRSDLRDYWSKMTKEELLEELWKESLDAVNMETRVALFMEECTNMMSKTTYTLDVIKNLIRDKQDYDLSEFCHNLLDDEYHGYERTEEEILIEIKEHAKNYEGF